MVGCRPSGSPTRPRPAPHVLVATAPQGRTIEFGAGLHDAAAEAVRTLVAAEPPVGETGAALRHEARCVDLVTEDAGAVWIERVPCFVIDGVTAVDGGAPS